MKQDQGVAQRFGRLGVDVHQPADVEIDCDEEPEGYRHDAGLAVAEDAGEDQHGDGTQNACNCHGRQSRAKSLIRCAHRYGTRRRIHLHRVAGPGIGRAPFGSPLPADGLSGPHASSIQRRIRDVGYDDF